MRTPASAPRNPAMPDRPGRPYSRPPDIDPAFAREVLAHVETLTLTTVGVLLADGVAACFAGGPVGLNPGTLWLLASLAPDRWRACSLAVFDDGRSVVLMADDAPPIDPEEQHRVRIETVTLPITRNEAKWRAGVRQLAAAWERLRTATGATDPFCRCRVDTTTGGRLRFVLAEHKPHPSS